MAGEQLKLDPQVMRMGAFDRLAGQAAVENPGVVARITKNIEGTEDTQDS